VRFFNHFRRAACGRAAAGKGGCIAISSRVLDYTGVFMLDCHMMNHEEMGMMQTVEVYED
jgi:hypothetical protein